jgi:rubrerythrin
MPARDASEFNVMDKVLEELLREEQRGQRFFSDASRFSSLQQAKQTFEWLAVEENRHVDLLTALQRDLRAGQPHRKPAGPGVTQRTIDYAGETLPVFEIDWSITDQVQVPHLELFKADEFKKLLESATVRDILRLAMRVEFDNFKYLVDLAKLMKVKASQAMLLGLADEERQHFVVLRRKYDQLD